MGDAPPFFRSYVDAPPPQLLEVNFLYDGFSRPAPSFSYSLSKLAKDDRIPTVSDLLCDAPLLLTPDPVFFASKD